MINIRTLVSLASALTLLATPAMAATSGVNVTIADITIAGSHARISFVNGIAGTAPACGNAHPKHFGIDLATNQGRAQLSLATSAVLSGKTVNVVGHASSCVTSDFAAQTLVQLTLNP